MIDTRDRDGLIGEGPVVEEVAESEGRGRWWLEGLPYFVAPDSIFDAPLSPGAKLTFLFLCRRANRNGAPFPSSRDIARHTGISTRTVREHLRLLEEAGWIVRAYERRNGRFGRRTIRLTPKSAR